MIWSDIFFRSIHWLYSMIRVNGKLEMKVRVNLIVSGQLHSLHDSTLLVTWTLSRVIAVITPQAAIAIAFHHQFATLIGKLWCVNSAYCSCAVCWYELVWYGMIWCVLVCTNSCIVTYKTQVLRWFDSGETGPYNFKLHAYQCIVIEGRYHTAYTYYGPVWASIYALMVVVFPLLSMT